jgi:hypothetical protein
MRESRLYGSVRGARGNSRPYREKLFCCTCSRRLLAHRVGGQGVELTSAYWGAAEVNGTDGLGGIDANDPERSKAGPKSRTAACP